MKNPIATIALDNRRTISIELIPEAAPNTVRNFIYLCSKHYFDNMIFCRVVNGRLIQSGDPYMRPENMHDATPGYLIKGEFSQDGYTNPLSFKRGIVGMAMGKDYVSPYSSAGSFFIMARDEERLDSMVTPFGRVIFGMDVVDEICSKKTHTKYGYDAPYEYDHFESVRVETFGVQYTEPERLPMDI